jgi:hypothetical protein
MSPGRQQAETIEDEAKGKMKAELGHASLHHCSIALAEHLGDDDILASTIPDRAEVAVPVSGYSLSRSFHDLGPPRGCYER